MNDGATTNGAFGRASPLGRLEAMLDEQAALARPPIHSWNPDARADIGLAIERDGTWTYQGGPITRLELVRLFASVLRREEDGRYFVVTPAERVPIRLADAPFLAVEMEVRGMGRMQDLIWRTNVDDVAVTGPDHAIRFEEEATGGLKPYIMIRDGLEARVTRAVYYDLVALAETATTGGRGKFGVWSGGLFFPMADADVVAEVTA
ncbi:MAG: DUF1285 domain-containing protein [Hyphomicrobiaceae bacterium]